MPYKDPEKQKEYQRKWHSEHKLPKSKQTSYQKRRKMVHEAKNVPCYRCKQTFPTCCMDFHHLDPTQKDGMVSKLMKTGTYKSLQEEMDKCVVMCANCHRIEHSLG